MKSSELIRGSLIKHKRNTDVAFQISLVRRSPNLITIEGQWLNIVNPDNIYPLDAEDKIYLPKHVLVDWSIYEPLPEL